MRTKGIALAAVQILLGGVFALLVNRTGAPIGHPLTIAGFALAFAVVSRFEVSLDFGRTQMTVSLTEIVLIVALFSLGPVGVAISGAMGHGVSRVARRVPPLKVLFNTANYLCALMVAASGFWLIGSRSIHDLAGWSAALGATL